MVLPLLLCFSSCWWLCLALVLCCWSLLLVFVFDAQGLQHAGVSSSLGPWGGCVGVCLVGFVFWRSGASAFSSSRWLRLPFVQWPSAASAYGWCCVLRFGSSSSFNLLLLFFFPFLPVLAASSLSVCVLWSPSCFPCLVSGLPLCLAWSAPPDLFLFLFLFFVLV